MGSFTTVRRLQVFQSAAGNANYTLQTGFFASTIVVDRCLFSSNNLDQVVNNNINGGGALTITNCVFIVWAHRGMEIGYGNNVVIANCTVVCPSDKGPGTNGIATDSQATRIINCCAFGFTNGFLVNGGSPTGSNNATDTSTISFGSSNLTSLTYSSQFTGVTSSSPDFRLKSGAGLLDAGNTDTTDIPLAIDMSGTSRPQGSAWDIGANEFIVAAATGGDSYIIQFN